MYTEFVLGKHSFQIDRLPVPFPPSFSTLLQNIPTHTHHTHTHTTQILVVTASLGRLLLLLSLRALRTEVLLALAAVANALRLAVLRLVLETPTPVTCLRLLLLRLPERRVAIHRPLDVVKLALVPVFAVALLEVKAHRRLPRLLAHPPPPATPGVIHRPQAPVVVRGRVAEAARVAARAVVVLKCEAHVAPPAPAPLARPQRWCQTP